ncbi:MAG TPA: sugar phosphate isomerase/epimerase family protein [Pirellulaceae bacterium]|nr:sugar phosphate isomerase/epimerase family protein [Pirellulaceae bacterium]
MDTISRRTMLESLSAAAAAALTPALGRAGEGSPGQKGYMKAVKHNMVQIEGSLLDKFKLLKELGFDGIELDSPGGPTAEEVNRCKGETGLMVPGVVDSVHWKECLSDPSADVRGKGLDALKQALKDAKNYGGTSVLLVPGRVTPDVTYQQCWDRSVAEIKKAVPLAEKLGIQILIENVWNEFLTDPKEMARFIDDCGSQAVGAHFDTGNTVRYSPPHEWIPILGKRIKKLDIKDYKKQPDGNLGQGFDVKLMSGDVDWPAVMLALKQIEYFGWGAAEIKGGDKTWLADVAARMDKIFAS